MEEYINSFNTLDISDFIKQNFAHIRINIHTDPEYINFVQGKHTESYKYLVKPILYRSYNDPYLNEKSYVNTVHNLSLPKIIKQCMLRQLLLRSRVKTFHSLLNINYPNIENQILC